MIYYTTIQKCGVGRIFQIFLKDLSYAQQINVFDQKYSTNTITVILSNIIEI